MGEIDYWELYGVEKPKDEGADETAGDGGKAADAGSLRSEVGGRAAGSDGGGIRGSLPTSAEGGRMVSAPTGAEGGRMVSAPTGAEDDGPEAEDEDIGEGGLPGAQAEEAVQGGKKHQSREENARYAAARRKQERDAAVQQARDEERRRSDEEMNALIAGMELENPYTGEKITTKAQYDAYRAKHQEAEHARRLKDMGMDQQQYDEMIAGLPEVQEAKRVREQAQKAEFDRRIQSEIEQISALNPNIRSLEDLVKHPKYDQIFERVDKGYGLADAYKLVNFEELQDGASRQKARNLAGKAHMSATHSRGSGSVDVPEELVQSFLEFNPGATREEIQAFYNRRHGRQ